ncbi:1-aminocyclopropane-1-carboxylate deaminase/D-cysteine desulfhydrase [Angelakisella massiliensis]|uniref:1-aminocyclopropane-1-carboxylate deaminase/D-cysteine desulfhydrase n=1 Tax=Angelakisella massiliensis TaxID=1871018 RepID=UPI0008F7F691|nr:pyridoxal-phosphate dependent enzyme [Angelakisella massiliensis]
MYPIEEFLARTPRVPLLTGPTPLHPMARFFSGLGVDAYIKRDDLTGIGPGGNKIRSLEFLLGQGIAEGCDRVLAAGPGQSNLCTLTAAACARLGLECELIHNCFRPKEIQGNLLLNELLQVKSHFLGPVTSEERSAYTEQLYQTYLQQGAHPFIIRNGATSGRGALGYTAAVQEMITQCRQQNISSMTIFAPGGNGGVAAGLIYGNALMGNPFRIVIVSVEDTEAVLEAHITTAIREAEEITGIPCPAPVNQLCEITDCYRGDGWGMNTPDSARMVKEFARQEGIFIENIYNSKVLVGMRDWIMEGKASGAVCYLHTGGFGSLFSQY